MEKCSKVGSPVKQWTFQRAKGGQSVIQHLIPFSTTPGWPPFLGSSILALLGWKKTHTLLYIHSLLLQAAPTKRNYPPGQNFVWVVEVCFPRDSCPSETWLIEIRISLVVLQSPSRVRLFATPWTAACQASLSLKVCPSSCPLLWWCHSAIPSSDTLFSFCPQSFPASGSFPVSHHSHPVNKILEHQLQYQSFQWIFRVDFL